MEDELRQAIADSRRRRLLPEPGARRSLRERVGVSQRIIADAIGVSRPSVTRWEAGDTTPRAELLSRYLDVLALLAAEATGDPEMLDPACQPGRAKAAGECRRDEA